MDVDKLEAGRELDALVAENVRGWHWVSYLGVSVLLSPEWHLNYDMQEGLRFPSKREHIDGQWFVNTGVHPKEWDYDCYPPFKYYSTDIAATWEMEEMIEQRGLNLRYTQALISVLVSEGLAPEHDEELWWALIHASPYQRCRAALKAISNGHP